MDTFNSNRRQMIDEIEVFQENLLARMPSNELEVDLEHKLTLFIKEFKLELKELKKQLNEFEEEQLFEKINSI